MWTGAIEALSHVAVVAEDLEALGITILLQPRVHARAAAYFTAMDISSAVDVIEA